MRRFYNTSVTGAGAWLFWLFSSVGTGRMTVKLDPSPGLLSMARRPPWRLTMCLTMASPRPVPPFSRERFQRRGGFAHHILQKDAAMRRHMLVELDAGQRQQILDQPAHPRGLGAHDLQELVACHLVILG